MVCTFLFIMYGYTQCVFYCSCYILFEKKMLSNSGHHVFAKDETQLQGSVSHLWQTHGGLSWTAFSFQIKCNSCNRKRIACSHTCTHSLTHSLTLSLTHSLTLSLTQSLTLSLTHSLTHKLTLTLTPSLTHSLTHLIFVQCPDTYTHFFLFQHDRNIALTQITSLANLSLSLLLSSCPLLAGICMCRDTDGFRICEAYH